MFDIENLVVKNKDMSFNLWKNAIIKSKYHELLIPKYNKMIEEL